MALSPEARREAMKAQDERIAAMEVTMDDEGLLAPVWSYEEEDDGVEVDDEELDLLEEEAEEGGEEEERPRRRRRLRGRKKGGLFGFSAQKLAKVVAQEQQKMQDSACRVVVVGATGSGKSSLINEFFGADVAVTGVGQPVTQDFQHFEPTEGRPVHLYDSKGFERHDMDLRTRTERWVQSHQGADNVYERLHVLWYVLDCGSARWLDADTEFCRDVFNHIPVIVVLHKADLLTSFDKQRVRNVIDEAHIRNLHGTVEVVSVTPARGPERCPAQGCGSDNIHFFMHSREYECMDCGRREPVKPYGHSELLQRTMEVLPNAVKQSFRAAQRANMHEKYVACGHIVSQSGKLSFLSGGIPLPLLDELCLNVVQVRQVVKIALQFGVQPQLVVAAGVAMFAGQYIVGQPVGWTKYLPIFGTAVGMTWCMPFYTIVSLLMGVIFAVLMADLSRWMRDYSGKDLSETEIVASYLKDIAYRRMFRDMWSRIKRERKPNRQYLTRFMEETEVVFSTPQGRPSFLHRLEMRRRGRANKRARMKALAEAAKKTDGTANAPVTNAPATNAPATNPPATNAPVTNDDEASSKLVPPKEQDDTSTSECSDDEKPQETHEEIIENMTNAIGEAIQDATAEAIAVMAADLPEGAEQHIDAVRVRSDSVCSTPGASSLAG